SRHTQWKWLLAALLAYVALAQGLGLYIWFGLMGQGTDWLPVLQAADGLVAVVALVAVLRGLGRPSLPAAAALLQGVTLVGAQVWMYRVMVGFDTTVAALGSSGDGWDLAAVRDAAQAQFWSAKHWVEFGAQGLVVAAMLLSALCLKQGGTSGPEPAH
ncbi:MAG TPA: hypothetical protein VNZ54_04870, partial [bacterium]|nr:hypothetical protein [bacterium]